jgi:hypothetical protein
VKVEVAKFKLEEENEDDDDVMNWVHMKTILIEVCFDH